MIRFLTSTIPTTSQNLPERSGRVLRLPRSLCEMASSRDAVHADSAWTSARTVPRWDFDGRRPLSRRGWLAELMAASQIHCEFYGAQYIESVARLGFSGGR